MKIGLVVSTADALPSAFVALRDDLGRCVDQCAELGYDGVELALRHHSQVNVAYLQQRLASTGLEIPCISTGQIFAEDRIYFTHPDSSVREEAVRRVTAMIRLAAEFQAKVNTGRVRGTIHEGEYPQIARRRYLECMSRCADVAEPLGVELIVEPVNRYEVNFINNCMEGLEIVRACRRACVRLMPDLFHMNIEDASFHDVLIAVAEVTSYIHIADSNRLAPGSGHLPFESIFQTLKEIQYNGWLTAEILPKPEPVLAAKKTIDFLRRYFPKP